MSKVKVNDHLLLRVTITTATRADLRDLVVGMVNSYTSSRPRKGLATRPVSKTTALKALARPEWTAEVEGNAILLVSDDITIRMETTPLEKSDTMGNAPVVSESLA